MEGVAKGQCVISLDDIGRRLERWHKNGTGYKARCPAHDDKDPSLSVSTGDDGRILFKCHAGCTAKDICARIGVEISDLFPGDKKRETISLDLLAGHKKLPASHLRALGLHDLDNGGVGIPYKDADGNTRAVKKRISLVAKTGSLWPKGAPLMAYGIDRLIVARELEYIVFVEGESDCWTLWYHGFPALGFPGADTVGKSLRAEHVDGIKKILFIKEPDKGGETFAAAIPRRLKEIGWNGELREISLDGAKDPSDMHTQDPANFKKRFDAALEPPKVELPPNVAAILRSNAFSMPQKTYETCFPELNEKICGGVKARQLTTIAAPTGAGKTGLVSTMALAWAKKGIPVLWIGTEIDNEEQSARFAAIDYREHDIAVSPDDLLALRTDPKQAANNVENLPIYPVNLDDCEGDPFTLIMGYAGALRDVLGTVPIIVIDYMQVLAVEDEEKRRLSVTRVSTKLRKIAKLLNTPVIAISSVSRAYYGKAAKQEGGEDKEEDPIDWLAAAKDSGDVEYSSAVFCYLDTSSEVNMLGESAARLIVAKSRRGVRGFVGLKFSGRSGAFRASIDTVSRTASGVQSRAQQTQEKVLRFVRGPVYQPMTKRRLRESVPNVRATFVDQAVDALCETGLLKMEKAEIQDATGRKRADWLVVPTKNGEETNA